VTALRRGRILVPVFGILALFAAQYALVRDTNFQGADEWLHLSLLSRGIIDFPYANRPLMLLWSLPAMAVHPHSLRAFWVAHGVYVALTAVLTFLITRRFLPGQERVAFLAGVFTATWVPLDFTRLSTLVFTAYSGLAFGTMLALFLFVESWFRRSFPWLLASAVTAFATMRGFEGAIPLLAVAPVALAGGARDGDPRRRRWLIVWAAVMMLGIALAVWPMVAHRPEAAYQTSILSLDFSPLPFVRRLLLQFGYGLLPLLRTPPSSLSHLAMLPAAALALAFAAAPGAASSAADPGRGRRALALAGLAGLAASALAYAPFALSPQINGPLRTHFLAAPGLGLLLASLVGLIAGLPLGRGAPVLGGLAGAWIVALGTTHVAAMQGYWDRFNPFWGQAHTLSELTRQAPGLQPHTLVVLLDETGDWRTTFSFRHATQYIYGDGVLGYAAGTPDLFYPTRVGPDGVHTEPWPVIRGPWRSPPTWHRFDEVVVVRHDRSGIVSILDDWPAAGLPPLPGGAVYAPRARIVIGSEAPPLRSRAVLAEAAAGAPSR
jgi:hypothetical protein